MAYKEKAALSAGDLLGLDISEVNFIIEYLKDYDSRRAAERAGLRPDQGNELLAKDRVQHALARVAHTRLQSADIDAEWVKQELVDNHFLARQSGKLAASNTALGIIAKLATVDAFAAEKVLTVTDQSVLERLQRARQRAQPEDDGKTDEQPVSFI